MYGRIAALGGVDLSVPNGVVFGLLGPNAAGKSPLIKALVGALRPMAGTVRVLNLDPLRDGSQLRRQIGYMPHSPALYDDLSARDNIAFFGRAHNMPDPQRQIEAVLEPTHPLAPARDRVHPISRGMPR